MPIIKEFNQDIQLNATKTRQATTCSICKQVGHTKRTCRAPVGAGNNQNPKRRKAGPGNARQQRNNQAELQDAISDMDGDVVRDNNEENDDDIRENIYNYTLEGMREKYSSLLENTSGSVSVNFANCKIKKHLHNEKSFQWNKSSE